MLHAHGVARDLLGRGARRSKEMYDMRASFTEYEIGDLELAIEGEFHCPVRQKGGNKVFHHDKMKLNQGRSTPKWVEDLKRELQHQC
ncbi:hypothetical protein MAR_021419 [Mya arenaria]|uniref:MHC class I antigen n=1 Tax=Mya arenaria TaxID=6604 RepID=A0ABY7E7N1_MYAAR|nr:hypothetical protein MAR_021419 [Mya arenaria]